MRIGIIGKGYVGTALGLILEEKHSVSYYDKYKECNDLTVLDDCEVIFICVPTPDNNGEIDLTAVEDAISNAPDKLLVIKSTVEPGTTKRLAEKYKKEIIFNPEFLRQDHAYEDMKNANKVIFGYETEKQYEKIYRIYENVLLETTYIGLEIKEAELVKYLGNIILAGQVSLANELYKICTAVDISYNVMRECLRYDNRIGTNIDVPGPDGQIGFGGACFPKDLNALISYSKRAGYKPELLEKIKEINDKDR